MQAVAVVDITGIAAGGAGVGRLPDGRAVFVQRTAPGDRAEVRILSEKRRWARAELVRLQRSSPDRREVPCPHYARCGGCTIEHLAYDAQLRVKAELVTETLRRIGGAAVETPDVVPSPREFRYRNRVSFTLVRAGTGRVYAGFHEIDRPERIADVTGACLLPEEPIALAWSGLRDAWGPDAQRLPSGRELRLTLRAAASGDVALLVEGGYGPGRPDELIERVEGLTAIWHLPASGGSARLLAGAEAIREVWQEEELALSGAVFLQVNRAAAALLEDHVRAVVEEAAPARVVDAYCGIGLHARRLARAGRAVIGIELDAEAVEEARRSAPVGASFIAAPVEEALPDVLPADLVILNPPRGGLHEAVPAALLAEPPRTLVYVSCNPATLARDLALLPSYRLGSIRCFDLFPQTAHVETVVVLEHETAGRPD